MIHDAKVEVTCDGERCNESLTVDLEYVYRTLSGAGGHYDFNKDKINRKVMKEGWLVLDEDGEGELKHYCWDCADCMVEKGAEGLKWDAPIVKRDDI